MKRKIIIPIALIMLALSIGVILAISKPSAPQAPAASAATSTQASSSAGNATAREEQAVRNLVARFGAELKSVPLLAPTSTLAQLIQSAYGPFISAELLLGWEKNPRWAPGRYTSSPWPEGILITDLQRDRDGSYTAQGKIIDAYNGATSTIEMDSGEFVAMKVRNIGGTWRITGFTKAMPQ